MKIADLIDRLSDIHNEQGDDVEVSLMTEIAQDWTGETMQIQHRVTDVAFSSRSGIIIIGQEID